MTGRAGPAPLVVRDDRCVVSLTGADRRSFLEATLSQRVEGRGVGEVVGALWLDVHGATQAAMEVVVREDDLLLVVPNAHRSAVVEGLAMRTFLADATFTPLDDAEVVAVRGHDVDGPDVGTARPSGDGERGPVVLVGREGGLDVVGPAEAVHAWLDGAGLPPATADLVGLLDHEVWHGVPRPPFELSGPQLPEEHGVLPTHVHLAKGCYPGQEAVARMWMLGRPRRRLVVVELAEGRPQPGDEAGRGRARWTVTRVTSEAVAPTRALVLGPGDVEAGALVEGAAWSGHVVRVVGEGRAQPGADPSVLRRRDREAGDRGPQVSREVRRG